MIDETEFTPEDIEAALERDRFMTAQDAKDWGLIDEIVQQRAPEPPKA